MWVGGGRKVKGREPTSIWTTSGRWGQSTIWSQADRLEEEMKAGAGAGNQPL